MSQLEDVGFDRPMIDPLPGSVKFYQRHVLVCTGRADWPSKVDAEGGFLQALAESMVSRASEMALKVKMTACDEASLGPGYDVLLFPDKVRYLGVQESDIPALVEDHLVENGVSERIPHREVTGQYILVCAHGARDERCGVCGPPLVEAFVAGLESRGLSDRVSVRQVSHVGGHKFAGNVLIYPGGDWYGYVTPERVTHIIDQHVIKGEVIADLWRGRMGLSPEEQLQLANHWLRA